MKNVSDVTAMVIDFGIFLENARVLGRTMKKVYYCNPSWPASFPDFKMDHVGYGFDEIELCGDVMDHFDEVDVYVFLDIGHGKLQEHLRSLGKPVWGSGMAEDLEFQRVKLKKIMQKKGLPVGPYKVIKGIDALKDYLKYNENQWVKIDKYRGVFHTFQSKKYSLVAPLIEDIAMKLGPFKNKQEFICEDDLPDCYEGGVDTYNIDGERPEHIMCGVEVKDRGYVAKFTEYAKVSRSITEFDYAMEPIFEQYGYRGFYSTEVRISKDKKGHMTDLCARVPSPPNELTQIMFTNLADIIWLGAQGICVDPIPLDVWGAEIFIDCPYSTHNWQPIYFPKKYADYVKIRNAVKVDGEVYHTPQFNDISGIGAVVGHGKTRDAAIAMAREVAESLEGYDFDILCDSMDEAEVEIQRAIDYGVWIKGDDGK